MKTAPKICHFIGAAGSVSYLMLGLVLCCVSPTITPLPALSAGATALSYDDYRTEVLKGLGLTDDTAGVLNCLGFFPCSIWGALTYYVFPIIVTGLLLTRVFAVKAMWLKIVNATVVAFVMAWTSWNLLGYTMICCCFSCINDAVNTGTKLSGTKKDASALELTGCFSCLVAAVWLYWAAMAIALGSIVCCDVCDNDKEVTTEATYGAV